MGPRGSRESTFFRPGSSPLLGMTICTARTRLPLDTRNSVRIENAIDVRLSSLDLVIESFAQFGVTAAHAHRDVEDERKKRRIDLRRDRNDVECHSLLSRKEAGLRSPHDGDVDVAARYGSDEIARTFVRHRLA